MNFFCFWDPFRTMDYPWLFMNKSVLSVQVILCIVENLENRILIVVSLVVFTSQKSSTCPWLSFLVYWCIEAVLCHHQLNLKGHFNQPYMRSSMMTVTSLSPCSFDVLIYNGVRIQSDQQISVQIFMVLNGCCSIFGVPNCWQHDFISLQKV